MAGTAARLFLNCLSTMCRLLWWKATNRSWKIWKQIPNLWYLQGDATHDEVLNNCHLPTAKALITTLPVDAHNLFVVLTAREINPKMAIISRASDEHSDVKLKRAGATNVIMPDRIGGQRMAKMVVQPDIVEFLEFMMLQSMESVALEEIFCSEISERFNGIPLREFDRQNDSGANIIGMKRSDKSIVINPLPELILTPQDKIFALGTRTPDSASADLA